MPGVVPLVGRPSRVLAILIALGLYLTLRGYHSRDGDQAYRLPLLLHRQDPALFAHDPFVRAFDHFNPHRGYLALLDAASRPLGLSTALAVLFAASFAATCLGIDRLARACWSEGAGRTGTIAVAMALAAKAGNLGTNHLFEAMLLDRLMALALGWLALAEMLRAPSRGGRAAALLGLATLVHPSLGLQLGMLAAAGWVSWAILGPKAGVSPREGVLGLGLLLLALVPGVALMAGSGARLMEGLPPEEFFTLSALVQSPQHMVPHLWRTSQWLAWGCYPVLAALALAGARGESRSLARDRLAILLGLNLAGLALAWAAIEPLGSIRATIFQPFRMATVARGLCLVLASGRVRALWQRGDGWARCRAALLMVGLVGDWALVAATLVESGSALAGRLGPRMERLTGAALLGLGLAYLNRHDTESGHWPLLAAVAMVGGFAIIEGKGLLSPWTRRRVAALAVGCWLVPGAALLWPVFSSDAVAGFLTEHCRFAAVPVDDVERLAQWCRRHTPESARFIGPPGPKTFRLWSLRDVAFNRAAGPYHAAGLADWAARFRDHVDFTGSIAEFAVAYLKDRQALERRYQEMNDAQRADLAHRQGATHVLAAAPRPGAPTSAGPLELLHVEGRYAVYRVRPRAIASNTTALPQSARVPSSPGGSRFMPGTPRR